jgi:hypothetical protein
MLSCLSTRPAGSHLVSSSCVHLPAELGTMRTKLPPQAGRAHSEQLQYMLQLSGWTSLGGIRPLACHAGEADPCPTPGTRKGHLRNRSSVTNHCSSCCFLLQKCYVLFCSPCRSTKASLVTKRGPRLLPVSKTKERQASPIAQTGLSAATKPS